MQFKHPELLYALFLLLIPIIIHLFQLRKFQKVDFTNVAFLQKVTTQTRKSSQLKKWLTLLTRLLAIACLVLAFAQPFTASKTALSGAKETVVYIDNSFSTQANGPYGPLLLHTLQRLYEQNFGEDRIHWFTNTETKSNTSTTNFKNEILQVDYTYKQLSIDEVFLKASQLFSKNNATQKRLIIISDFQQTPILPDIANDITVDVVQLKPATQTNIAIDSAYINTGSGSNKQLKVIVSGSGEIPNTVPVSLYQQQQLIAKTSADFSSQDTQTIDFDLDNISTIEGKIEIIDPNLLYDNNLYFSINSPDNIKILSINQGNPDFLQRLFSQQKYDYTQKSLNTLNYNEIAAQDFIVLNDIEEIPVPLINSLIAFSREGGSIAIIPARDIVINSYNSLLSSLKLGTISGKNRNEKNITKINFSHPIYTDVFEKKVANFQYPTVKTHYELNTNATPLLSYADQTPFLIQQGNSYFSTGSYHIENSNFKNSPLIVPTLINMAQQSLPLPELYYTIGKQNSFAVPVTLSQDAILTLKDSIDTFIPLQQTKSTSVFITTQAKPDRSGNFTIKKEQEVLKTVSYNYPRLESNVVQTNIDDWDGVSVYPSVNELFDTITNQNKINSFWKWFVIFALLFLVAEMLMLKFMKH